MVIRFRRRKPVSESRGKLHPLKQACEEFGRKDLYEPLSWVLSINIKWLDAHGEYFLKKKRYVLAANMMLYESKIDRAREYFQQALRSTKIGSARRQRLSVVLENLDVVSKIAIRSWELAGKRTAEGPLFTKILVAVDGSKSAAKAVNLAVRLGKRSGAKIFVVSVIPTQLYLYGAAEAGLPPIGDYWTYPKKDAEQWVNQAVATARKHGIEANGRVLNATSIVQSITDYAKDKQADLVLLGTRGSGGFDRLLLGSVSNGVVSHAHCAVMVVRDQLKSERAFSRILVAVDGSDSSSRAVKHAVRIAKRNEAKLLVVSVVQKPVRPFIRTPIERSSASRLEHYYAYASKNSEEWTSKAAALARSLGVNVESRVLKDTSVVKAITNHATSQQVDLIVVGRRGTGGFKRLLLGGVSTGVMNHASSTVLIVR